MLRVKCTYLVLAAILLLTAFLDLKAQDVKLVLPSQSGETIELFCDRTMYCASEKLFFSAFYIQSDHIPDRQWSNVLYTELISWDGSKIAQQKARIQDGHARGYFSIPEGVKSGNYYLRAYTRWMRNYSPYTYTYIPVKIVNPFIRKVEEGPENTEYSGDLIGNSDLAHFHSIEYIGLKEVYNTRQEIEIEILLPEEHKRGTYCLGVALSETQSGTTSSYSFKSNSLVEEEVKYLPEIRGISLSGKVVDKATQVPLVGEKLTLSSTVNPFYYSNVDSDSSGNFIFSIPEFSGTHQFCINAVECEKNKVEFLIDNEYCNKAVTLPHEHFVLSKEEEQTMREMMINAQLQNKTSMQNGTERTYEEFHPFYGTPQSTTYIKDYIELIDLKEFLFELIPDVYIKSMNRDPYIKLVEKGALSKPNPLLLLDNIPVPNDVNLLSIPTRRFDRIEVINGGYVAGKHFFSGIISIYSAAGDLAGLNLHPNASFFSYSLYGKYDHSFPDYSREKSRRTADMRNLLHWKPNIELSPGKPHKIKFFTSDATGNYTLTLQGKDEEGNAIIFKQVDFSVEYSPDQE